MPERAISKAIYHVLIAQQLKQQRDKLKQYQRRIEQSLEKDRELARKCLQTGRKEYVACVFVSFVVTAYFPLSRLQNCIVLDYLD